jgi:hypothetical protein
MEINEKFDLLKCPRMRFLWVSAIMAFGNPAAITRSKLVRRRGDKNKNPTSFFGLMGF